MPYSFDDDMLKKAIIKVDEYYLNSLPKDEDIDHQFSHRFEKRMKKLIKRANKQENTMNPIVWWRKPVIIIITCSLILFTSAMSIAAVRKTVFEFIHNVYEKYI